MKLALSGTAAGLVGVFILGHLMSRTLYGVKSVDLGSFAAVALTLLAVAVAASYIPARRSANVDPVIALGRSSFIALKLVPRIIESRHFVEPVIWLAR